MLVAREIRGADADLVITDDRHGIELVLDHLVGLGHQRIAHVDAGRGAGAPLRRSSYLRGMKKRGLEQYASTIGGDYTEEAGVRAARALIEDGDLPTAVSAANDMMPPGFSGSSTRPEWRCRIMSRSSATTTCTSRTWRTCR